MPSTASTRLLAEKQAAGENLNTWGGRLNTAIDMFDAATRGRAEVTVNGTATLTGTNYTVTSDTAGFLDLIGTGGTLTIPTRESIRHVYNGCSAAVIITTGSGTTVTIQVGELVPICTRDGVVRRMTMLTMGGARLTNVGTPTASTDAVTKQYADDLSMAALVGTFPAQSGNAGKFLGTNGTVAAWTTVLMSHVSGLEAELTDIRADFATADAATIISARNLAIAMALTFAS